MIIATQNAGGRSIVRATAGTVDLAWGYRNTHGPMLHISLAGADGKRYDVSLDDADLNALRSARLRYSAHFPKPPPPADNEVDALLNAAQHRINTAPKALLFRPESGHLVLSWLRGLRARLQSEKAKEDAS
jgi:hypothetical protein